MLHELNLAIESGRNVFSVQCQLPERAAVIEALNREILMRRPRSTYLWNLGQRTFTSLNSHPHANLDLKVSSPLEVIERIADYPDDGFFILEDLHPFLSDAAEVEKRMSLRSQLINLAFAWADTGKYAVLLGTQGVELPSILTSIIPEFENPLPHYEANVAILEVLLPQLGLLR
jgi:hypothetical protein